MKYRGYQTDMWDAWFINVAGRVHAFHLQQQREDTEGPLEITQAVGHIYSDDLLHWHPLAPILPPLFDLDERDYHQKYTGSVTEINGKYIVYYTMRDKSRGNQRIAAAISDDLHEFSRYSNNPVLMPDERVLIGYENISAYDWNIVDCRDLITVKCEADGLYYGYFAAAADVGRQHPVGVIAVAVSDDLLHWREQSIVYIPAQNGVVEVPDVYEINGKWYLTMLSGGNYVGRANSSDPNAVCCTIYAVADGPRGPFRDLDENVLITGNVSSGYACRTIVKDGKRYLLYVDRSSGGSTLSLPKEMKVNDKGELGAYYAEIVQTLRIRTLLSSEQFLDITACELVPTSFAWRTFGGEWTINDNIYCGSTTAYDYQALDLKQSAKNIEMNAEITMDAWAAGFYVHTYAENDSKRYIFVLEPDNERVLLASVYHFAPINVVRFRSSRNTVYQVKLLMIDGQCELYVDEKLVMQCGIDMLEQTNVGLFCDRGKVTMSDVSVYELES